MKRFRLFSLTMIFVLLLSVCGCGGQKTLTADRSILAEQVTGTVLSYTENDSVKVVSGEKLISDRYLSVSDSSDIVMLLDSDKHVYAGEETRLHFVAEGKTGSTKTRIDVLEGLLVCAIDNKLGAKETFEVNTPNAILTVRGTEFTTQVLKNSDGTTSTALSVKEGTVEATTCEDGVQKTVFVGAGESLDFEGESPEWTEPEFEGPESQVNSDDSAKETTSAKRLWRTYERKEENSSTPGYLYIEVFVDEGRAEIKHAYYNENTYSTVDWPIENQRIRLVEYTGGGGTPNTWEMYMEYNDYVLTLYELDVNGNLMGTYLEFELLSEEVLE